MRLPVANFLMSRDDGLVVAVTERRVLLHDVVVGDALRVQEVAQDLVGRARVDVVGAEEHPALGVAALLAHQVLDGRDRLLVGRRARVEDVPGRLFALVLHGVEEQAVQLLEDRQHRLARDRGPAAEGHGDLLVLDQVARLLGEQRPVRGRVDDHRLELAPEHAARLVDLLDGHQRDVLERRLADRHRPRQRVQDADLDRPLVVGRRGGAPARPARRPAPERAPRVAAGPSPLRATRRQSTSP